MATSNVLLISIDSLRADYMDLLDIHEDPFRRVMDALQNTSRFTQAVANGPSTPASFPSILTSTYPFMYGGYRFLDDERPFVARTLSQEGYSTVAYHSNPHLSKNHNYHVGFDTFEDSAEGSDTVAGVKDRIERRLDPDSRLYSILRRFWHYFSIKTDSSAYAKATTITDDALEWLNDDWDGEPFFMWLHYMDVHYPFMPPEECLDELGFEPINTKRLTFLNGSMQESPEELTSEDVDSLLKLYLGEIVYVANNLVRLFERLETAGVLAETAVFVTADHGEAFGEHGKYGHHPGLYDELLRVPLFASIPGVEGQTIDQQVELVDIGPTIYDILDVEAPPNVQGRSLRPLVAENRRGPAVAVCGSGHGDNLAARTEQWKYIWRRDEDSTVLYDLEDDPDELVDVANDNPGVVERFQSILDDHVIDIESTSTDHPDVTEDDEVQQRLEDLGYV